MNQCRKIQINREVSENRNFNDKINNIDSNRYISRSTHLHGDDKYEANSLSLQIENNIIYGIKTYE